MYRVRLYSFPELRPIKLNPSIYQIACLPVDVSFVSFNKSIITVSYDGIMYLTKLFVYKMH